MANKEEKEGKKRLSKRTKIVIGGILLALVAIVLFFFWYYFWNDDYSILIPERVEVEEVSVVEGRFNVLILGVDADELHTETGRADAIIVASVDIVNESISLLSIPRDSYVEIPGYGMDKINHSYHYGGVELVKQTVQDFLQVPIDYYAVTNFDGFEEIVDILGGVEIDVDKRMYYRTYDSLIDIEKGLQVLDGEKALQYVRFRHDPMGDITRTERQQKFLIAVYEKAMSVSTFSKLPQLIPAVLDMLETDFTMTQLVRLADLLYDAGLTNIKNTSLPGTFGNMGGVSYWIPDRSALPALVLEYFGAEVEELPAIELHLDSSEPSSSSEEETEDTTPSDQTEPETPSGEDPSETTEPLAPGEPAPGDDVNPNPDPWWPSEGEDVNPNPDPGQPSAEEEVDPLPQVEPEGDWIGQ